MTIYWLSVELYHDDMIMLSFSVCVFWTNCNWNPTKWVTEVFVLHVLRAKKWNFIDMKNINTLLWYWFQHTAQPECTASSTCYDSHLHSCLSPNLYHTSEKLTCGNSRITAAFSAGPTIIQSQEILNFHVKGSRFTPDCGSHLETVLSKQAPL